MAIIVGNSLNNLLVGTAFPDTIAGQGGNDVLLGLAGNDILRGGTGNDVLNGGAGIDTADYNNGLLVPTGSFLPVITTGATAGVRVDLNLGFQNTVGAGFDTLVLGTIENLTGTNFIAGDTLIGNGGINVLNGLGGNDCLFGNAGNDTLLGGDGNDTLNGGLGADILNGGLGTDTASYIGGGPVNVNLNFAVQPGAGFDNLVSIENLVGSSFNDVLTGNAGNNELCGGTGNDNLNGGLGNDTLNGGLGNDTLNGGLGIDTADYSNKIICGTLVQGATGPVTVNLNNVAQPGAGGDLLFSIENVTGTNFNDTLIGNGGSNVLNGLAGNDVLSGLAGNDFLLGGLGNDFLLGGTGNDSINGGDGTDSMNGGDGNDSMNGGTGSDTLNGGNGNDLLDGGAGRDSLTGSGGALAFDTFDYNAVSDSLPGVLLRDVITDFQGNGIFLGDRIDLSTIDANALLPGNQAFTAAQLSYGGGVLSANIIGTAPVVDLQIQLVGAPPLVLSDIVL